MPFVGAEAINKDNAAIAKGFKGESICEPLKATETKTEGIEAISYCLNDLKETKITYGIVCVNPNNTATGALEGPKKESETCGAGHCV